MLVDEISMCNIFDENKRKLLQRELQLFKSNCLMRKQNCNAWEINEHSHKNEMVFPMLLHPLRDPHTQQDEYEKLYRCFEGFNLNKYFV